MASVSSAHRTPTSRDFQPPTLPYVDIFRASQSERIDMIKAGVPASDAKRLIGELALTYATALTALNLSASSLNRKIARGETLTTEESERVLGVARMIGQVQAMVEESGRPEGFDAVAWLADWLAAPLPAFGGRRPLDFLDTMEGQELIRDTLSRTRSGAYA